MKYKEASIVTEWYSSMSCKLSQAVQKLLRHLESFRQIVDTEINKFKDSAECQVKEKTCWKSFVHAVHKRLGARALISWKNLHIIHSFQLQICFTKRWVHFYWRHALIWYALFSANHFLVLLHTRVEQFSHHIGHLWVLNSTGQGHQHASHVWLYWHHVRANLKTFLTICLK